MGNVINIPNITPEVMDAVTATATTQEKRISKFDAKNYLDTRIEEGKKEKKITIRILPDPNGKSPFTKVHVHNVEVPKELCPNSKKPYKSYICIKNTDDIDRAKYGNKCPFCEINQNAYKEYEAATDPVVKEDWKKMSLSHLSNEAIIVRCIERGKENEGVKFWKFNIRQDRKDAYHTIINLYNQRKAEGEESGVEENILDIYNGYDLTITFTDGTPVPPPTIVDAKRPSPLSNDEEQMKKWIYDEKTWSDVFPVKDYNYLSLVAKMKVPFFDKKEGVWISKEDWEAKYRKNTKDVDEDIKEAEENIAKEAEENIAKEAEENIATKYSESETPSTKLEIIEETIPNEDKEDDLPF